MSWQDNEHSLLDLDDPTPSTSSSRPPPRHTPQSDPFASNRPSISYDDFVGQSTSSSSRPYPLGPSASNVSLGTMGTQSGVYPQQSYFDDSYNDDDHILIPDERNTQRSRRSNRESGSGISSFFGRVTGGRIGSKQPDLNDMDLPLTQTGVAPAGISPATTNTNIAGATPV